MRCLSYKICLTKTVQVDTRFYQDTDEILYDYGTTAHRGWPCENNDEEMGLSRRCPVGGLRLRGATDDGPPPLLSPTRRGLHG